MTPKRFSKAWFVSHADHFMISIASSLAVSIAVSAVTHHLAAILRFAHVPASIIHFLGY